VRNEGDHEAAVITGEYPKVVGAEDRKYLGERGGTWDLFKRAFRDGLTG
jgi:hypothetical protein